MSVIFWSLFPVLLATGIIWLIDRRHREPLDVIAKVFISGIGATVFCTVVTLIVSVNLELDPEYYGNVVSFAFYHFALSGFLTEICIFAVLRFVIWDHRNFDHSFDGIVYSVTAAMGFCCVGNLISIIRDPSSGEIATQSMLIVPENFAVAVIMGAFFAKSKTASFYGDEKAQKRNIILSAAVPSVIQSLFGITSSYASDIAKFLCFVLTVVLDLAAVWILRWAYFDDEDYYAPDPEPAEQQEYTEKEKAIIEMIHNQRTADDFHPRGRYNPMGELVKAGTYFSGTPDRETEFLNSIQAQYGKPKAAPSEPAPFSVPKNDKPRWGSTPEQRDAAFLAEINEEFGTKAEKKEPVPDTEKPVTEELAPKAEPVRSEKEPEPAKTSLSGSEPQKPVQTKPEPAKPQRKRAPKPEPVPERPALPPRPEPAAPVQDITDFSAYRNENLVWTCECGSTNMLSFCVRCGKERPKS